MLVMENQELPPPKLVNGAVFRLGATYLPAFPETLSSGFLCVAQWVFVPVTAAGQRGLYTPLPRFHPFNEVLPDSIFWDKCQVYSVFTGV